MIKRSSADENECAICALRHRELLETAHIVPDRDELGVAEVFNGLSLCEFHHSAYDSMLTGVDPGLQVAVREDLQSESDGPMLVDGLQGFNAKKLRVVPKTKKTRPDRDLLQVRWEKFKAQEA